MSIDNSGRWWPRLLPLLAATLAVGADAWIVAGFLSGLAADMDVDVATAGLSVTVFALAYTLGAPVLAAATSGTRPRVVITAALVLLAGANMLTAASTGFGMFMTGRVLAALAACVVTPAAGVLAARVAGPEHRGRALALVISGLTIATAIGVPAGSLIAQVGSWRQALGAVAVLAASAGVTILLTAPDPAPGPRQRLSQRLAPLRERRVLAVLGLTTVGMTAAYVPYAYAARLLSDDSSRWLVVVLACYGAGAVAGSVTSGTLTDRIGPTRTLTIGYVTMIVAFAVMATRPTVGVVAGAALAWGFASWTQTPPQQHRLIAIRPDSAAVTIGTNASALYAGVALGNTIGAAILPDGDQALPLTAAFVASIALAWNLVLGSTSSRRGA